MAAAGRRLDLVDRLYQRQLVDGRRVCARDGFQISPHATQRQYVLSLIVLLAVVTLPDRQKGQAVTAFTSVSRSSDAIVNRVRSGNAIGVSGLEKEPARAVV
jgi:hypothetical protein